VYSAVKVRGWARVETVVRPLREVAAGEFIAAEDKLTVDPERGQKLKAQTLRPTRPDSTEGIREYLPSGLMKGIGPDIRWSAGRSVWRPNV
jgi:exodeoxyribonuclease V alpha subunit